MDSVSQKWLKSLAAIDQSLAEFKAIVMRDAEQMNAAVYEFDVGKDHYWPEAKRRFFVKAGVALVNHMLVEDTTATLSEPTER